MNRAELYRLLADAFYQPTEDGVEPVDTTAALKRLTGLAREAGLPEIAERHLALTPRELREEYFRVFTHTLSRECPPYETEYGEAHIFMQTQDLGDIAGFYRAFGLAPRAKANDRPDALGFELEFMHALAAKEEALAGTEGADVTRDAAAKFLRDHLLRWIPAFTARLERRAEGGVFASLARLLRAWILRDAKERGIDPEDVRSCDLKPASFEPGPGDCSSCGMGDIAETFFNQGAKP